MIVKDVKLLARMHAEACHCEFCEESPAVQLHHIKAKGIGGGSCLDVSFNLIMLCVECHAKAHDGAIPKSVLWGIAAEREVRRLLRQPKEGERE